jgi:PASTA domain
MTAFVEECRREWKRLGVPDSIADEMASELDADLTEASADGVSAAEILGESDPRRFAASWASARGLALEGHPQPRRRRRYVWWILAAVLLLLVTIMIGGVLLASVGTVTTSTAIQVQLPPVGKTVPVPDLVGLKATRAIAILRASGLEPAVASVAGRRAGVVVAQAPSAGARVARGSTILLRVGTGG